MSQDTPEDDIKLLSYKELQRERRKAAYKQQKARAKAFRESPAGKAQRAEQKAKLKEQRRKKKERENPKTEKSESRAADLLSSLRPASELPPLPENKKKTHLYLVKK